MKKKLLILVSGIASVVGTLTGVDGITGLVCGKALVFGFTVGEERMCYTNWFLELR